MGLLVYKGDAQHFDDFDVLEEFAAKHRTKIISVELWGFERMRVGKLCVRWRNGAIAEFIADDLSSMYEYVKTLEGWPEPTLFPRLLPYASGHLYVGNTPADADQQEEVEEPDVQTRVVRRRRSDSSEEGSTVRRQRRARASAD